MLLQNARFDSIDYQKAVALWRSPEKNGEAPLDAIKNGESFIRDSEGNYKCYGQSKLMLTIIGDDGSIHCIDIAPELRKQEQGYILRPERVERMKAFFQDYPFKLKKTGEGPTEAEDIWEPRCLDQAVSDFLAQDKN